MNNSPTDSTALQRRWGNFQLLLLVACIALVLVASVHMVSVAVSSQPGCADARLPGSQEESYIAAKRSC